MTLLKLLAAIAAIATISITSANTQEVVGSAAVTGAGSTFAYPIIARWSRGYQHWVAGGGSIVWQVPDLMIRRQARSLIMSRSARLPA